MVAKPFKQANPPLTKTQILGVDLLKALAREPRLRQARISVGTSADTITLDGNVPSDSARRVALQIAQQNSSGHHIVNRLVITPHGNTSPLDHPK